MKEKTINTFTGRIFVLGILLLILCYYIPSLRSAISYYTPSVIMFLGIIISLPFVFIEDHIDKRTSHEKIWAEVVESNLSGVKTYFIRVSIKVSGVIFERYYEKNDLTETFSWMKVDEDKAYRYNNSKEAKDFADKVARKYEVVKKTKAINTVIYSTAKKLEVEVTIPVEKYSKEEMKIFLNVLKRGQEENIDDLLEQMQRVREPVQVKH